MAARQSAMPTRSEVARAEPRGAVRPRGQRFAHRMRGVAASVDNRRRPALDQDVEARRAMRAWSLSFAMHTPRSLTMSNPPVVSNVLLTMFSWGVRCGARTELDDMLEAVRVLHPRGAIGDVCEARMEIGARNWLAASRILRQIDERGEGSPIVWALSSWCLHSLDDIEWQRQAHAVLDSGNDTAVAIIDRFLTQTDDTAYSGYRHDDMRTRVAEAIGAAAL
jgi:type III secretion protein HrpB1